MLEQRLVDLQQWARHAVSAPSGKRRLPVHHLYLELASFTSAYLAHQDLEERAVMPALDRALGADGVAAIDEAIVACIPSDEMARALSLALPAMNNDDRAELLGALQASPEELDSVWSLARSVLEPRDITALERRVGL